MVGVRHNDDFHVTNCAAIVKMRHHLQTKKLSRKKIYKIVTYNAFFLLMRLLRCCILENKAAVTVKKNLTRNKRREREKK